LGEVDKLLDMLTKTKDTAIVVERPNIRAVDGGGCRKGMWLDVIAWSWGENLKRFMKNTGWLDKDVHGRHCNGRVQSQAKLSCSEKEAFWR
jgi:hypothetical protein